MISKRERAERTLEKLRRTGRLPTFSLAGMMLLRMRRCGEPTREGVVGALRCDRRLGELAIRLGQSIAPDPDSAPSTLDELVDAFGASQVRNAALAISMTTCNRVGICTAFDYDQYWSKCLAKAAAASELAHELGGMPPMDAFAVALLAELGSLTFASAYPEEYAEMLESSEGEPSERLLELETGRFGTDQAAMSVAFLAYLCFPRESCQALVARTFAELSETGLYDGGADATAILSASERISETFMADAEGRTGQWFELVNLRYRLQIERDVFNHLGDRISQAWWEWGELLSVPTRHVPSFAELAHQALQPEEGGSHLEEPHDSPTKGQAEVERLNVLVVDDDPTSLRLLERSLLGAGHRVSTASDGKQALQFALEDTPHLIVADWMMPNMTGLELCQALRRFDAGRRIFFMLVTGREEEARMIEAFEAGVDDFINKPFRLRPFLARVRGAMRVISLQNQLEQKNHRLRAELGRSKLLTRKLSMAALTDMLTELPNRRYAIKRLAEDWANSDRTDKPLSVVLIDIDHFKAINDTHGHDVGDVVLRETAHVLEKNTRQDESACRVGGEEFLVICDGSDVEDARRCAERLRTAVEEHLIDRPEFRGRLTISAGVAEKTAETRDLDHLLKIADEAVYVAKERGRNRVVVGGTDDRGLLAAG